MTLREKLNLIMERVQDQPRCFLIKYATENGCAWRTVQFGADMRQAFADRVGEPNGKGNWHTGRTGGKGYGTIYSVPVVGNESMLPVYCIRGIDTGDNKAKIFRLQAIWECKFEGETLW